MNIEKSRIEINAIDEAIVKLLDRRAKIVSGIGAIKAKAGIPVFDRRRESEVCAALPGAATAVLARRHWHAFSARYCSSRAACSDVLFPLGARSSRRLNDACGDTRY